MGSTGDRGAGEPRFGRRVPARSVGVDSGPSALGPVARGGTLGRSPGQAAPVSSPGCRYAIRVEGLLDAHWSEWLEGMALTHEKCGVTRLEGALLDQAALHGVLNKIRDLRLVIITLERLGTTEAAPPSSQEPPESSA
jgi:hypothetical protein